MEPLHGNDEPPRRRPLGLTDAEAEVQFEKLQAKLIPLWKTIRGLDLSEQGEQTLFDICIRHGLHFEQARQTGVLLHMLPTVGENGRFGVVAVGDTAQEAEELCERIQAVVHEEAKRACTPPPLPKP